MSIEILVEFLKIADTGISVLILLYVLRTLRKDMHSLFNHQWSIIEKLMDDNDE